MTNEEILKKAIKKATHEGGFEDGHRHLKYGVRGMCLSVIFSHDFAKAFWGEEFANCSKCGASNIKDCCNENDTGLIDRWQYHLREMVLEKNPILYLSKFL